MRTPYESAKSIARKVVLAQDASDAGKRTSVLSMNASTAYSSKGYAAKNTYILAALREISTTKPCGWNFYVIPDQKDQNGYWSVITYFQYKSVDGVRYEVSFTPRRVRPNSYGRSLTRVVRPIGTERFVGQGRTARHSSIYSIYKNKGGIETNEQLQWKL